MRTSFRIAADHKFRRHRRGAANGRYGVVCVGVSVRRCTVHVTLSCCGIVDAVRRRFGLAKRRRGEPGDGENRRAARRGRRLCDELSLASSRRHGDGSGRMRPEEGALCLPVGG